MTTERFLQKHPEIAVELIKYDLSASEEMDGMHEK